MTRGWLLIVLLIKMNLLVADEGFEVGFAVADITPPVGWRRAGGYHEEISTGVNDPLFAKAMVIKQGNTTFALIGDDLCSVAREVTDQARAKTARALNIPISHLAITATHTHGGPEYTGPLRDLLHQRALKEHGGSDPHEPIDYQAKLVDSWVKLYQSAWQNRKPMQLAVVMPQQLGLAFNRRYLMRDGSTGWNPGNLNPNIRHPLGPVDPDLPFLFARDSTGKVVGGLTVFAMHTAIYGGQPFSACYPAHLQTGLRDKLKQPELVSIFAQGCAGNINHVDVSKPEPADRSQIPKRVGETLSATLHKNLSFAKPVQPGKLAVKSATVKSLIRKFTPKELEQANEIMATLDRNQASFLQKVSAWRMQFQKKFRDQYGEYYPGEIQAVRFDQETALVLLPHEVFVEIGLRIKASSPFRTTIVISLANDIDFYIPTRRAFLEGHYEPTTCPLEVGVGEQFARVAEQLLLDLAEAP